MSAKKGSYVCLLYTSLHALLHREIIHFLMCFWSGRKFLHIQGMENWLKRQESYGHSLTPWKKTCLLYTSTWVTSDRSLMPFALPLAFIVIWSQQSVSIEFKLWRQLIVCQEEKLPPVSYTHLAGSPAAVERWFLSYYLRQQGGFADLRLRYAFRYRCSDA